MRASARSAQRQSRGNLHQRRAFQIRSRKPEAGSRKPEARSRKPKAESRKPEAGSRKPKAESRKPKARTSAAGLLCKTVRQLPLACLTVGEYHKLVLIGHVPA